MVSKLLTHELLFAGRKTLTSVMAWLLTFTACILLGLLALTAASGPHPAPNYGPLPHQSSPQGLTGIPSNNDFGPLGPQDSSVSQSTRGQSISASYVAIAAAAAASEHDGAKLEELWRSPAEEIKAGVEVGHGQSVEELWHVPVDQDEAVAKTGFGDLSLLPVSSGMNFAASLLPLNACMQISVNTCGCACDDGVCVGCLCVCLCPDSSCLHLSQGLVLRCCFSL